MITIQRRTGVGVHHDLSLVDLHVSMTLVLGKRQHTLPILPKTSSSMGTSTLRARPETCKLLPWLASPSLTRQTVVWVAKSLLTCHARPRHRRRHRRCGHQATWSGHDGPRGRRLAWERHRGQPSRCSAILVSSVGLNSVSRHKEKAEQLTTVGKRKSAMRPA